jgi:hypothetical protein
VLLVRTLLLLILTLLLVRTLVLLILTLRLTVLIRRLLGKTEQLLRSWKSTLPEVSRRVATRSTLAAPVTFQAGRRYTIRLEYYENWGGATIRLRWRRPGVAAAVPVPLGALSGVAAAWTGASPASDPRVREGTEARCAAELQTCELPAGVTATVFYGADSRWAVKTGVAGRIACDNATFGDPAYGTLKACVWRAQ